MMAKDEDKATKFIMGLRVDTHIQLIYQGVKIYSAATISTYRDERVKFKQAKTLDSSSSPRKIKTYSNFAKEISEWIFRK